MRLYSSALLYVFPNLLEHSCLSLETRYYPMAPWEFLLETCYYSITSWYFPLKPLYYPMAPQPLVSSLEIWFSSYGAFHWSLGTIQLRPSPQTDHILSQNPPWMFCSLCIGTYRCSIGTIQWRLSRQHPSQRFCPLCFGAFRWSLGTIQLHLNRSTDQISSQDSSKKFCSFGLGAFRWGLGTIHWHLNSYTGHICYDPSERFCSFGVGASRWSLGTIQSCFDCYTDHISRVYYLPHHATSVFFVRNFFPSQHQ